MKKLFSKEIIIGLTVIITILILYFGIEYLKGVNLFKAANYYYASYTNVTGLAQSAPVTVNGYKVGLVREIEYEYDNPGHVKVELSLDRKLRLPQGTEAVIVTDMLGTSSVELKMGTSDQYYSVGDYIMSSNATGLMDNVTNELLPGVASIMPKIDSLLTAVTTLATDPALVSSIQRLDNVMANLEKSTAQLAQVMKATPGIAQNADSTMANVKQISADLAVITEALKDSHLDTTLANIEQITASLNAVTRQLNSSDSSMGLLLNDPTLYNNLNGAVSSLDSLLQDVKKNPKRYISIKLL